MHQLRESQVWNDWMQVAYLCESKTLLNLHSHSYARLMNYTSMCPPISERLVDTFGRVLIKYKQNRISGANKLQVGSCYFAASSSHWRRVWCVSIHIAWMSAKRLWRRTGLRRESSWQVHCIIGFWYFFQRTIELSVTHHYVSLHGILILWMYS